MTTYTIEHIDGRWWTGEHWSTEEKRKEYKLSSELPSMLPDTNCSHADWYVRRFIWQGRRVVEIRYRHHEDDFARVRVIE